MWQVCDSLKSLSSSASVARFESLSVPLIVLTNVMAREGVMLPMLSAPEPELMTNWRSPEHGPSISSSDSS